MRVHILRALSILVLVLAVVWFFMDPGPEPVITALLGLAGLLSAGFAEGGGERALAPSGSAKPVGVPDPGPPPPRKSVLVLPFDNLSTDPQDAYLADGLTDEIITDLSYVHSIRVISRRSAMALRGTQKDLRTLGIELGVQYVLEGSVQKARDDLRITAQLTDAGLDQCLWAKRYDGSVADVFDLQEQVSRSVVDALKVRLRPEEEQRVSTHLIRDTRAYECYLRAMHEMWRWTEDALDRAERHLHQGLEIIGENPLILAGLGELYATYFRAGFRMDPETLDAAEHNASTALRLSPDCISAQRLVGELQVLRGDALNAVTRLTRVLEVDPNDAQAMWYLVYLHGRLGNIGHARPLALAALEVDPLTPRNHWLPAWVYWMEGRFDEALDLIRKFYDLQPDSAFARWHYIHCHLWNGLVDEVEEMQQQWIQEAPTHLMPLANQFLLYGIRGQREQALGVFSDQGKRDAWRDYHLPMVMAEGYALINELDEALEWLERALEVGWANYPMLTRFDPFLQSLRDSPGFLDLIGPVREQWQQMQGSPGAEATQVAEHMAKNMRG